MKCKQCKVRMSDIFTEHEYEHDGIKKKIINVPAYQCPQCNNIMIPDLVREKLGAFAEWEKGSIVDYAKCEQNEADIFATLHTFKNLLGL